MVDHEEEEAFSAKEALRKEVKELKGKIQRFEANKDRPCWKFDGRFFKCDWRVILLGGARKKTFESREKTYRSRGGESFQL